jgi:hypothetical protein
LRAGLVEHVLDSLGLKECADVILGNEMKRGVSGGQKKRVTLAEALLTGSRLLALDEVTNGLDSATAQVIVEFLVAWARSTGGTVVAALQAPTPELFSAFDEVLLLSDGRLLFQGPPGMLKGYLAARGYHCPDSMDIADYAALVCVSPVFAAASQPAPAGFRGPVAGEGSEALAAQWALAAERSYSAVSSASATGGVALRSAAAAAQWGARQVHSSAQHVRLLLARQSKVVFRNPAISFGRVVQFIILACIFGSVYYQLSVDDFITKISMSIFAASAVAFAAFAEIPAIFASKRAAARQMQGGMYGPFAFVLSVALNSLPVSLISTAIFGTIIYWMVGFSAEPGRFFFFLASLVCHELSTAALFRFYGFLWPTEELAAAAAGISTGTLLIFGGFYIAFPLIPDYFLSL